MDKKTILVPFSQGAATPSQIALACSRMGLEVRFVVDKSNSDSARFADLLSALGTVIALESFDDIPTSHPGLVGDGIVTFSDENLVFSAKLAQQLGLPFNSVSSSETLTDKYAARICLNSHGLPTISTRLTTGGMKQNCLPEIGSRHILKPRRGSGSKHTFIVDNTRQLAQILNQYSAADEFVLEEVIEGSRFGRDRGLADYLSVESIAFEGKISHIGITGRLPLAPPARETGLLFPLQVENELQELLFRNAESALKALNFDFGIAHSEFKLSSDGPKIIEVNGRLGGGLADLFDLACGIQAIEMCIDIALGNSPTAVRSRKGVALHHYVQPPVDSSHVESSVDLKALRNLPHVVRVDQYKYEGDALDWLNGSSERIGDIWFAAPTEDQLLSAYNDVQVCVNSLLDWKKPTSFSKLIEPIVRRAQTNPTDVAVIAEERKVTYAELIDNARRLSEEFHNNGISSERVVAIEGKSTPSTIEAVLATIMANGAFLLLEPNEPVSRREEKFQIAQPQCYFNDGETKRLVGQPLISKLPMRDSIAAYVAFTSGTTGKPKATVIEIDSATNYFESLQRRVRIRPNDRQLQFSTMGFDIAIEEIFLTLRAGATLVLRPSSYVLSHAEEYVELCRDYGITVSNLPTGMWNKWGLQLATNHQLVLPPQLRLSIIGGESANEVALTGWTSSAADSGFSVFNTYGPTETTIAVTGAWLNSGEPVSIGQAFENVKVFLLDEQGRLSARGRGEIVIAGDSVGRGYIGLHDSRFTTIDGQFVYRTGDKGHMNQQGELFFEGRLDSQVKVPGGYRVEPGELRSIILSVRGIQECVVLSIPDGDHVDLAAFIVADISTLDREVESTLRNSLKDLVPHWMLPKHVIELPAIPLTARGKTDHQALKQLVAAKENPGGKTVEAARKLETLWCNALGYPSATGLNFFEAGGNSLSALRLFSDLEDAFGSTPTLLSFYEQPTLSFLEEWYTPSDSHGLSLHIVSGNTITSMHRGDGDVLWCFLPPLSGAVTRYARISRLFPSNHSVWAMQTPFHLSHQGMGALIEGLLEELATKDLSPFRHINFAGYSLGGVFAYEMARRAQEKNLLKASVSAFMIDPPAPGPSSNSVEDAFDVFVSIGLGIGENPVCFADGSPDFTAVANIAREKRRVPQSTSTEEIYQAWQVYASNAVILDDFTIQPCAKNTSILLSLPNNTAVPADGIVPISPEGPWNVVSNHSLFFATRVSHFELMEPPNDARIVRWLLDNAK